MVFNSINDKITKALSECGIKEPTEIQEKAIPVILEGKDVIGISKTGSGKTAAFGIPLLEQIESNKKLQIVVLAPTRELAIQISRELTKFGKYLKFNIATVYGGVGYDDQIRNMKTSEILVGTPGRILDHLERDNLNLQNVKYFVLDEADKMVSMGFIEDITRILQKTPKKKQMLLFGATISNEVKHIKAKFMKEPITIKAEMHVHKEALKQYFYNVRSNDKFSLLVHLLKKENIEKAIIFCSTIKNVEFVARNLEKQKIKAERIHGKLTQNRRIKNLDAFNHNKVNILIASAVAARGLDIKFVTHVFNYDLSQDAEEYIHRVGRTARAGEQGKAITLLSERDHDAFRTIIHRFGIEVEQLPLDKFEKVKLDLGPRTNDRRPRDNQRRFNRRRY
tara:strand:+ start:1556 stop:2737 length:1182 start_codon:yes stop_codon:yes gene_type:complete